MRKVLTLEVWEDETMLDSRECVNEVINVAIGHLKNEKEKSYGIW